MLPIFLLMKKVRLKTKETYLSSHKLQGKRWGVGKMDENDQKVQTSSYKISQSWGYNVQHSDYG